MGPSNLRLTCPLGDSDVLSLTEKRGYKFPKGTFKVQSRPGGGRPDQQRRRFNYRPGRVGPRAPDPSATRSRTHAPSRPSSPPPPPPPASRPTSLRPAAAPDAQQESGRRPGARWAPPAAARAGRGPPSARPAPLSAPRAAPSRPPGVRTLGGWDRRRDRGGKEEERGGRLSAGVVSCRHRTSDYRPARPAEWGFCGLSESARETTAPGRGGASPLAGAVLAFQARKPLRPAASETGRAWSGRLRLAGERG